MGKNHYLGGGSIIKRSRFSTYDDAEKRSTSEVIPASELKKPGRYLGKPINKRRRILASSVYKITKPDTKA